MKKRKLFLIGAMAVFIFGSLTVNAAADLREISSIEGREVEYNGTVYEYTLQKQYETSNPDEKISFDEKLDGNLKLDAVTYDIIDTILQKKTVEESKDYKELLEKDESKIPNALNVGGETYNLDQLTWSEEPNIEHVSYTQDYGYAASEPEHPSTYEYTYTSPVTKKENTVTLPFIRMEKGEYGWVDGFTATITFRNLEGELFKLGSHEFAYNADRLSLTESDYRELVKMLGYDTSKYRLNSVFWSGKAYEGKNGEMYRDAKASGQQYAAPFKAVYEDDVENGKMYTAHATYSCEVEVPAEEAAPTYVMQATAYYRKQTIPLLVSVGVVILIILVITVLYTISRKQKKGKADQ